MRDRAIALVVGLLAASCWALAEAKKVEDTPAKPETSNKAKAQPTSAPAEKITPGQIAHWTKELDHDSSRVRDRATKDLIRAGKAAIGPVAKAAKGKSLEVTTRCVEVLKALLASKDAETKNAAKAALQKLAADKNHEAGRLAKAALEATKPDLGLFPENLLPREIRAKILGRAIPIQIGPGNVAVLFNVTVADGQREVIVKENGRKIHIKEDKKQIVVTVTEAGGNVQGKPKPKVYKAANADELKKKHPEAYKLYQKHVLRNRAAAAVVRNIGIGPILRQVRPRRVPPPRIARNLPQARRLLAEAQKELRESVKKLQAARKGKLDADQKVLEQILKEIEAVEKKLAEAGKRLAR